MLQISDSLFKLSLYGVAADGAIVIGNGGLGVVAQIGVDFNVNVGCGYAGDFLLCDNSSQLSLLFSQSSLQGNQLSFQSILGAYQLFQLGVEVKQHTLVSIPASFDSVNQLVDELLNITNITGLYPLIPDILSDILNQRIDLVGSSMLILISINDNICDGGMTIIGGVNDNAATNQEVKQQVGNSKHLRHCNQCTSDIVGVSCHMTFQSANSNTHQGIHTGHNLEILNIDCIQMEAGNHRLFKTQVCNDAFKIGYALHTCIDQHTIGTIAQ